MGKSKQNPNANLSRQELREKFTGKPIVKLDGKGKPMRGPALEVARCGARRRARAGEDFLAFGAYVRRAGSQSRGVWWPFDRLQAVEQPMVYE